MSTNPAQELLEQMHESGLWEGRKTLKRGEFLTLAGSRDRNFYYVLSGSLRVILQSDEEEHTIRFGYRDSVLAALDAFLMNKPTDYAIQALKRSEVQYVSRAVFMDFLEADPQRMKYWQQVSELLICQQLERETDLLTGSPKLRYERVLKRSPQLFQEVPHKYIASYLRMTPETLSRLQKS